MTPTPQEYSLKSESLPSSQADGNRVVISGMSGLYPQSHNVKELSDILYNKINPVRAEDLRFKYNHPEVAQFTGSVPELNYFDAQFFKIHYRLAQSMDPMSRKILEQTYQAIYDAGINPDELSGKKVGVYIGSCFSETEKSCFYTDVMLYGLGIAGCSKTMYANRISYWLNAKGPSMAIDEACCSSTAALEQAFLAISRGDCEAAVVGGSYLCLHPQSFVHYGRVIMLSSDGKTKSFDEHADGCAKSEAINVLFLQKAKDALRIYAEVLHVKTEFTCLMNNEVGTKWGFCRSPRSTVDFMKRFYEVARVPPQAVEYVEAFGSALPEADKIELEAIDEVFCKNRSGPLPIGTIMSNIGYSEAASGISAVTKVLLGYHNGELAANLHCEQPRTDVAGLRDGRIRVVTEHQRCGYTYMAVNGMSVTGLNSHVLLHGHYKPKDLTRFKTSIPYLVNISGRHEDAVKHVFELLKSNPIDPEQLALLHNIHRMSISGHLGRGFIILQTNEDQKTECLRENAVYFDNEKRPLWYVYSGMGSQWTGMGDQLMRIPIFADAIERCRKVLQPKGLDIVNIITSSDEAIFSNILHSFVGIAAIQIGLTDIMRALGLTPDGIIGHSVGELGCAYADGCLTAEEMILSAYYRGLVSLETKFIHGSMAAIGLGYEEISKLCPPEIEVACHNGPDSSTISGPSTLMQEFVAELTAKGIFAKEVPCSNIAYHSSYIQSAGPALLNYLKEAIGNPKARSERWISSSVPKEKWEEPLAKLCSAEYLTNNLLSPVLFEETSKLIPSNAVLVEIAPHGLLQAILKRSMPASCVNIPLTRRKHPDNTFLLEAIGKLYVEGYNCDLRVIYPKVEMPVSTGTPFLSHFIKWAHAESWPLTLYSSATRRTTMNCSFILSLHDKEHEYLAGHSIRGNILYPFAASLNIVWETLAMTLGVPRKELSVTFDNLELYVQPVLHDQRQLKLDVAINRGNGRFEVLDGSSKVVAGFINEKKENNIKCDKVSETDKNMHYTREDIYQILRDRDYYYSGEFQSIECVDETLSDALLVWNDNWVTLIDGMLQMNMLRQPHNAVSLATRIRGITIDVKEHSKSILNSTTSNAVLMKAEVSETLEYFRCGGIIMESLKYQNLPPVNFGKMVLKKLQFVSNFETEVDVLSSLKIFLQIVAENINKNVLSVVGVRSQDKEGSILEAINNVLDNDNGIKIIYKQITGEAAMEIDDFKCIDLIITQNLSLDENICQKLQQVLQRDQFVVNIENKVREGHSKALPQYRVLSAHSLDCSRHSELQLIRWGPVRTLTNSTTVLVRKESDIGFLKSVHENLTQDQHLLVITSYPPQPGLKELVSSWRKEDVRNNIYLIVLNNGTVDGNLENKLRNVELAFNHVDVNGNWGGEFFLPEKRREKLTPHLHSANTLEIIGSDVNVNVHYVGINTDMPQYGDSFKVKANKSYGMDFSGITESGERVMGVIHNGTVSTQVCAQPELMWPVPAHWSLEDAATVPLAYMQAFYCLKGKDNLKKNQSVLVHGGAGALGQAVISIALALDCEVFATVSDLKKKHFLLKLFPQLKAEHIGNSRDHTFAEMVRTQGNRCDIVISCAKPNLKDETMNCVAAGGRFLDISQLQNYDDFDFGMHHLTNFRNYIAVDFSCMYHTDNMKMLSTMLSEGIARGYVRPLSRVTYLPHESARASKLLWVSQHRGRVLLNMKESLVPAQSRLRCDARHSYVILSNNTSIGLQLADMLVARGAKLLCVHVQTKSNYLQHKIQSWQQSGVKVLVSFEDLNKHEGIVTLLNKTLHLGPVDGIYVTVEQDKNINENLISNLDLAITNLCPHLRHFAVINIGNNSIGKNVCLNRIGRQLPATMLMLPELNNEQSSGWRGAVDAVERALQSTHGVFLAHKDCVQKPSLLKEIATLAGISVPENARKNLSLEELGIQNHTLQSICSFLRINHNLAFDEKQVLALTIADLLALTRTVIKHPREDIKGLSIFFNYVDSDELFATTEMVFLPTLVNSATMRDDEFDPNQTILAIVPGMEGHHERFRVLCERLKLTALVLQPGLDHIHETIQETAKRFAEVLLKKTGIKDKFYLLGYESGVFVALEVAAILESRGLSGTIFCMGCAPDEFGNELKHQLTEFEDDTKLQEGVLRHMYTLMTGEDTSALEPVLQNLNTWSQKLDACVRTLLGRVSHSGQYARSLIESAIVHIQQARQYSTAPRRLRSQLVLLRSASPHAPLNSTHLQQYSLQPVIVYQMNSPLAHITTDLRCTAIINEHLDSKILEDYSTRNNCETYLLNAHSYIKLSE